MRYDRSKFEVVVVDQKSTDGLAEVIAEFSNKLNITVVTIDTGKYPHFPIFHRRGFCNPALAQNVGVAHARGSYVVLTSPEIVHDSGNLEHLDAIQGLDAKFVYGRVLEKPEEEVFLAAGPPDLGALVPKDWDEILCDWPKKGVVVSVYYIGVMHRDVFLHIGGIDEFYLQGTAWEDDDFGNRIVAIDGITSEYKDNVLGVHLKHDRAYQEGMDALSDKERNKKYHDWKEGHGWEHFIVANRGMVSRHGSWEMGTPEVVECVRRIIIP